MWGVWEKVDGVHVASCDEDGFSAHLIQKECDCQPSMFWDLTMYKPLWEHNEEN